MTDRANETVTVELTVYDVAELCLCMAAEAVRLASSERTSDNLKRVLHLRQLVHRLDDAVRARS